MDDRAFTFGFARRHVGVNVSVFSFSCSMC